MAEQQLEHFPNLVTMFFTRARAKGDKPFLWAKKDKEWQSISWAQAAYQVACVAQSLRDLGLNKGDVSVLRALLFCLHKSSQTLVFASNDTLSRQADGMPVRTLSRHIGRLVDAGLAVRHDSPTKRRYVRRSTRGIIAGYGIDLAPLFENAPQIALMAVRAADDLARIKALQDEMSCLANRVAAIDPDSELVAEARRERRRKPQADRIVALIRALANALPCPAQPAVSAGMAGLDSQNGRPDQKAILEEESDRPCAQDPTSARMATDVTCHEKGPSLCPAPAAADDHRDIDTVMDPADVLRACPEAASFAADRKLRSWHDLAAFAWELAGWMNIDQDTLRDVAARIGIAASSATILAICQAGARVRSPGAYLRKLSCTPGFSPVTYLRRLEDATVVRGRPIGNMTVGC